MKSLKNISAFLMLMLGLSIYNSVHAQQIETIDLNRAIQQALDSNLTVRSSVYSVDMNRALKGASWDLPKTSIDGQYGQFNSYTRDNGFTISQSFAFPTVYLNQNKLANANIKSSEWQLKESQLEIAAQVKQAYWQLVYLYSKQELLAFQDSLFSGFSRAAERRAQTGETNRLEMITARSQSLEVKNQLQQVSADLNICMHKLQMLLNSFVTYRPADSVLHRAEFSPLNDSAALAANPSVGYMQQQVEVSRLEKKVERSQMMPDFSIGYFSQTMQGVQEVNGIPRTFGTGDRFSGIEAGIAIPLWFVPYTSKTKAARLKEQVSLTDAEYYLKTVMGNYQELMGAYVKFGNSLEYYEKQAIPEADLIIEQATLSYKAGAMDYLDYLLNLNRALDIKQNYLEVLNNYNQTIVSIEFIAGKIF